MGVGIISGHGSFKTVTKSTMLHSGGSKVHILPVLDFEKPIQLISIYCFGVIQRFDEKGYMYCTVNIKVECSNDCVNWMLVHSTTTSSANNYQIGNLVFNCEDQHRFRYYRATIDFGNSGIVSQIIRSAGFTVTCKK